MAGLPWVRVDASLARNHKVLALMGERGGDHALCVYIFGLGHCGEQGSSGFIPAVALGVIHGRARDAELLVQVGLWHEVAGGYEVNDFAEYQPVGPESTARTERARKAAQARWAKKNGSG